MIDDDSKYKRESRISKSSPLAHARNARTRALLSPFCASLLLGRKHYLRGLYALCGFIYFNCFVCQIYSKSRPQNWYTKVSEKSFRLVLISIVQAVLIVGCRTDG